jgi:hypothetical protein
MGAKTDGCVGIQWNFLLINARQPINERRWIITKEEYMDKFVVIGGDAAGMSAASRARRMMPELNVTVFEKTNDVSYSA